MKHFKHPETGDLYAYESDGSQDEHIPAELVPITDEEAETIRAALPPTAEQVKLMRQAAYIREADPLFFKAQRGEATNEEWLAKLEEIKTRFPLPA